MLTIPIVCMLYMNIQLNLLLCDYWSNLAHMPTILFHVWPLFQLLENCSKITKIHSKGVLEHSKAVALSEIQILRNRSLKL